MPAYTVGGGADPGRAGRGRAGLPGRSGGPDRELGHAASSSSTRLGEVLQLLAAAARLRPAGGQMTGGPRRRRSRRSRSAAARPTRACGNSATSAGRTPGSPAWPGCVPWRWPWTGRRAAAAAARRPGGARWPISIMAGLGDCIHPDGRWQRTPTDERVDAALLRPVIHGAVPAATRGRWPPSGGRRRADRRRITSTASGRTLARSTRPRAPSCCADSGWPRRRGHAAMRSLPRTGSSAAARAAARPACTPRNTTCTSGSCAATCRRHSCTQACWRPRCGCPGRDRSAEAERDLGLSSADRPGPGNRGHAEPGTADRRTEDRPGAGRTADSAGNRPGQQEAASLAPPPR